MNLEDLITKTHQDEMDLKEGGYDTIYDPVLVRAMAEALLAARDVVFDGCDCANQKPKCENCNFADLTERFEKLLAEDVI